MHKFTKQLVAFLFVLLMALSGCMPVQAPAAPSAEATTVPDQETPAEETPVDDAPMPTDILTPEVLATLLYTGIYTESVQLIEGLWEGEPFDAGSASRPQVMLSESIAIGDLNGDGLEDAAAILLYQAGGTGNFAYLAAVIQEAGVPRNVANIEIGDRPIINSLTIVDGQIHLDLTVAGPDDAMCCPTKEITQTWELQGEELVLVDGVSAMDVAKGLDASDSDK